jgi:hypothetical protein
MDLLFSTPANRMPFLGRCLLTIITLLFATVLFLLPHRLAPHSDTVFLGSLVVAGLIALPTLYYFVRFAVMARLESVGLSAWHSLHLLWPFVLVTLYELQTNGEFKAVSFLPWDGILLSLLALCVLLLLLLFLFPENVFTQPNVLQALLHDFEVGEGGIVVRIALLMLIVLILAGLYNFGPITTPFGNLGGIYHGLNDVQSMDTAQLARQIARGEGYTTEFLRPYAVRQLHDFATTQSLLTGRSSDLFPADRFPEGVPRVLPDTYNPPGYPYLLAAWYYLVHPHFDQPIESYAASHVYSGDRWVPFLNLFFLLLNAALVFGLSLRLFDVRVAWMALVGFLVTNMIWQFTLTALSTTFLMFLVTASIGCALEIFCVGEACFESEETSFHPAWLWALLLSLLLIAASLTRFEVVVMLAPLLVLFFAMPRANFLLPCVVVVLVLLGVLPWFWHMDKVCGNPLGSNLSLLLLGAPGYEGNQIYCATSIPGYESLLRDGFTKEYLGFQWHFEHAWELLGYNPLILLFVVAALHGFKRPRAMVFYWLLIGCALVLILVNNLGVANPEAISQWNAVVLLFPCLLVIGSAYFFILFDRLYIQIGLLRNLIVIAFMSLTALPMVLTFATAELKYYNFPPYMPPWINIASHYAEPNEWVTSDMPWACAWYGDHASLWLPDSVSEFVNIHDNVNPSGVIILTPVTWAKPVSNLTTGEDKDWLPFVILNTSAIAPDFPLNVPVRTGPGGPDYIFWSDRPRWQTPSK